jgi:hypothetical protein
VASKADDSISSLAISANGAKFDVVATLTPEAVEAAADLVDASEYGSEHPVLVVACGEVVNRIDLGTLTSPTVVLVTVDTHDEATELVASLSGTDIVDTPLEPIEIPAESKGRRIK